MQFKLRIRQYLHREPSAKYTNAQRPNNVPRILSKRESIIVRIEWKRKWKGNNAQNESFRQEDLHKRTLPKSRLFLHSLVPRIVRVPAQGS
jgi:hypothetical protein